MISEKEVLDVREPPGRAMGKIAELWKPVEGTNKIMCTACARYCKIGEGQVGLCGIRGVHEGKLWLYVYGRVITGHVDPIEKKPVSHYRPGSKIFSIATTGCNWLCHPAGTPIKMADGDAKPVEEIRAGDVLESLGNLGGQSVPSVVTSAGNRKAATFRIDTNGLREALFATAEHPILTPRGWTPAGLLRKGDKVLLAREGRSPFPRKGHVIRLPQHSLDCHGETVARFWELMQQWEFSGSRYEWASVNSIRPESPKESVYSFECVPFHNYAASHVVAHNCRYCFIPGTQVLTDKGHVGIEELFRHGEATSNPEVRVVKGVKAMSHQGRWRLVQKAFEHLYSGPVVKLRPFYLPGFECTPDHAVFAAIGGGTVKKMKAGSLRLGDYLAVPLAKPSSDEPVDVEKILRDEPAPGYKYDVRLEIVHGRIRRTSERGLGVPAILHITPRVARLFGYYCAEGSLSRVANRPNSGSVWFSFGAHEESRIREVEKILGDVFGIRARRSRQKNRTAVIASSATLATVFRHFCGDSSATKRVPEFILRSGNKRVLKAFLTGYLNGDGYVTKSHGRFVLGSASVSQALTYGVAQILFSLDEIPRVYRSENDSEYEIEGRIVNRSDDHMVRLLVDHVSMTPQDVDWEASDARVIRRGGFILVPIREISRADYVGPVYNIEVEEDHSYTANFMAVSNCQNADISQRRKVEGIEVEPQDVVRMTVEQGCQGLAYTYNQPTIFIEFARDIGMLARKAGLINIFVSNGYDTPETVAEMPKFLDCVTVDFKGSGETNFVRKYINIPNAEPIFQTILDTRDTKKIHIEITDLIVPQVGDDLGAARKLSKWVYDNLGPDTPIHFLRFHPDYKMMEFPWTPVETLEKHCTVAKEEGLKYVYIGNVSGHRLENTYCPGCGAIAIKRYGFDITGWYLGKDNKCKKCGYKLAIFGRLEQTAKENRFYSVLYHR